MTATPVLKMQHQERCPVEHFFNTAAMQLATQ